MRFGRNLSAIADSSSSASSLPRSSIHSRSFATLGRVTSTNCDSFANESDPFSSDLRTAACLIRLSFAIPVTFSSQRDISGELIVSPLILSPQTLVVQSMFASMGSSVVE